MRLASVVNVLYLERLSWVLTLKVHLQSFLFSDSCPKFVCSYLYRTISELILQLRGDYGTRESDE